MKESKLTTKHKALMVEIINKVNFPGAALEDVYELKQILKEEMKDG